MIDRSIEALPRRPPSEMEWEDLLLKLELMPRALRVVLERSAVAPEQVEAVLASLVEREVWAVSLLDTATRAPAAAPVEPDGPLPESSNATPAAEQPIERFVRFRSRTFAMVQRRGLEVWDWLFSTARGEISAYQLLGYLVRCDVEALESLRGPRSRSERVC